MTAPVFELSGATVALGAHVVLHGIDFRLHEGEFVALLGDNGSGKTTLVRALVGLVPLAQGALEIFSVPSARFRERHRIGYVPQRLGAPSGVPATAFEVVLSGRAAVLGPLHRYRRGDRELAASALETVGLGHRRNDPVASLSSGQQQRVLIARALAARPDVLILDEPASALDAESQDTLAATLGRLKGQGHSLLLVAHGLGPIEPLVTRVVVLEAGSVAYDGPPLIERAGRTHLHVVDAGGTRALHGHHHPPAEAR
ncbi:MAG: metal ABC transporter ATP-binding protein [Actinomycetota bacterium]